MYACHEACAGAKRPRRCSQPQRAMSGFQDIYKHAAHACFIRDTHGASSLRVSRDLRCHKEVVGKSDLPGFKFTGSRCSDFAQRTYGRIMISSCNVRCGTCIGITISSGASANLSSASQQAYTCFCSGVHCAVWHVGNVYNQAGRSGGLLLLAMPTVAPRSHVKVFLHLADNSCYVHRIVVCKELQSWDSGPQILHHQEARGVSIPSAHRQNASQNVSQRGRHVACEFDQEHQCIKSFGYAGQLNKRMMGKSTMPEYSCS